MPEKKLIHSSLTKRNKVLECSSYNNILKSANKMCVCYLYCLFQVSSFYLSHTRIYRDCITSSEMWDYLTSHCRLVNWSQMKPAIGPFLCVILNFVCCRLLNNAVSGAWGSDVACVCAECCQVRDFPAELGYFNTVAAGCFSCPWVEATPITWYLAPGMRTLPRNPSRNAIGLVLG